MHSIQFFLGVASAVTLVLAAPALKAAPLVAAGNHHSYFSDGVTQLSVGENFFNFEASTNTYRLGKLGRPSDLDVAPGAIPGDVRRQHEYNVQLGSINGLGVPLAQLSSGQNDGAAITTSGQLYVWGPNDQGQLGVGDQLARNSATLVVMPNNQKVTNAAIGGSFMLVTTEDGAVFAAGRAQNGVLGTGATVGNFTTLQPLSSSLFGGEKIIEVAVDSNRSALALTESGKVYAWGRNAQGQIGQNCKAVSGACSVFNTPVLVQGLSEPIRSIFLGSQVAFAVGASGKVYGWGDANEGHFGSVASTDLLTATLLPQISQSVRDIQIGSRHAVLLDAAGQVWGWGQHTALNGQLGLGQVTNDMVFLDPMRINLPQSSDVVVAISSLTNHTLAATANGEFFGWGSTGDGKIGPATANCLTPAVCWEPTLIFRSAPPSSVPLPTSLSLILSLAPILLLQQRRKTARGANN